MLADGRRRLQRRALAVRLHRGAVLGGCVFGCAKDRSRCEVVALFLDEEEGGVASWLGSLGSPLVGKTMVRTEVVGVELRGW